MTLKPKHVVEWLVCHAFVGGCFLLPAALGIAYEAGTLGFESERPSERTATYMASMSLIPFPDADADVLEVTEELLAPPSKGESGDEVGSEAPLEQNSDDGQPSPEDGRPEHTPTAEDVERVRSGGPRRRGVCRTTRTSSPAARR